MSRSTWKDIGKEQWRKPRQRPVEVIARAIKQMPSVKSLVKRCEKAVGWQRLLYRLRLLSVPEGI